MNQRSLLIVADDLGLSPEVNEGILDVVRVGRVTVVAAMVNPPYHTDFASFHETDVSIGIHLNLTHGRPCLDPQEVSSLVDSRGQFLRGREQLFAGMVLEHAEKEMTSQTNRFRQLAGQDPEHITVHKNLHMYHRGLLDFFIDLARSLGASLRVFNTAMRDVCRAEGVKTSDHFIGDVRPAPFWTIERLASELAVVPAGLTEMMCHPGRNVKPMQDLRYIEQRDVERETLLSDEGGVILSGFQLVNCHSAFLSHELR